MTPKPRPPRAARLARAARDAALFACLAAGLPAARAAAEPAWAAMPAPLLPQRLPVATTTESAPWRLHADAADFSAADAVPVRDIGGDWARYQPRAGRNAALQSARFELAATRQQWELAANVRSELLIDGSRGAFDVVQTYKQRLTPADGSRFDVDVQERGVVTAGLRGARTWALGEPGAAAGPAWQLTAALTLLSVRRVQQVDAQGQVHYGSLSGYDFDAQTLRLDTRRPFGGWGQRDARGSGWSADLGLLWQPSDRAFVNLSLVDLASRLHVSGVATEATTLSSATHGVDAAGYLDYKPLVLGRYSASDLDLRLARKTTLSAGWRPAGWREGAQIGARWQRIGGLDLPAVWAHWPLGAAAPGWALQLDAETRFRSLGVGLASRQVAVLLRSRSWPVGGSHALGWQVSVQQPF